MDLSAPTQSKNYEVKEKMSKYDFPNAKQVIIVENQSGGETNMNKDSDNTLTENALDEMKNILTELNNKYPNVSETTATEIINAEFTHIQNNQPQKWAIIKHIFDGKRWLNGGKTALIKVGEHYSENNVFYKAAVGFGEGFTEN